MGLTDIEKRLLKGTTALPVGAAGQPSSKAPYTVKEVAGVLRLSLNAVYEMIRRDELPAVRFGRAIRLPREKIDARVRGDED
jgi:excisionase family DNA binding protein